MLSCEFFEISKNTFFTEHLWEATTVSMLLKDEFAFSISLCNQRSLTKKTSATNTKKFGLEISYIDFTAFCKKHFLEDKRHLCALKVVSHSTPL